MKKSTITKLTISLCLLFLNITIKAQDIIIKKDGTEIQAKVLEITSTDVKYKRFDYIDGPTVTLSVSEINSIKYPNGKTEILNKNINTSNNTNATQTTPNEIKDGIVKTFYPTGELLSETPYVNGNIEGIQKLYYKMGKLISETPFKGGLANGICKIYFKNGNMMQEVPYVDGNITGALKYYNKKGKNVGGEFIFIQNKSQVNKFGILEMVIPYSNGIINGIVRSSLKKGGHQETPYRNNLPNGTLKIWNKKEVLIYQSNYVDGEFIRNGSILGEVAQGLQQGIALNNMTTNTNSQTVNDYTQIALNNYTKPQEEALKANSKIIENSTTNNTTSQINSESSAVTNGGTNNGNSQEAAICAKQAKNEWYSSQAYTNYMHNQSCNKFAYIAQKKLAEILLKNCKQYLPQTEIDGFNKTIESLTTQINGMPNCENLFGQ